MNDQEAQIEKYLEGQMNEAEQASFEEQLDTDPLLESSLREALLAKASIWESGLTSEKAKLDRLFNQAGGQVESGSAGSTPFRPQAWLSIAAAITILVAVGYLLLNQPPEPQELFATHYELPSAPEQLGAPGIDSLLQLAHSRYNQGKYKEAIPLYRQVTELNGRAESWQYLAYAQLELGNTEAAIGALLQDTQPNDRSEWYLALAYLKIEQIDKAKAVLAGISADANHDFYKEAIEIQDALK